MNENSHPTEVNLSSEFENVVGPKRQEAIAQLVMTATEFPDITSLRFKVNDKTLQVTSPTRGDTTTVTACDFALLLPTAEQADGSQLPAAAIERLNLRRQDLAKNCPESTRPTR